MVRRKTLKNILLNTSFGIATTVLSLLPNFLQGQEVKKIDNLDNSEKIELNVEKGNKGVTDLPEDPQHPMYGLNLFVPAWDEDYQTNTDWYGSGDINGDGVIDMLDYNSTVTGNDPFNDGTHRGDTDLDGDSGDADDKAIIMNYINGNITHINKWELESETEKQNHLEKALAIDPTSEINAGSSGWLCGDYSAQTFVNFNGIYDIANSIFAGNNGTNLQFDLNHNGIFRIPLRMIDTKTTTGIGHVINNVYLGTPENQDVTEFPSRLYIEPQTDQLQEPGDFSLSDYANERWYGYYYNDFSGQWMYSSVPIINYDLDANPIVGTNIHPDLVESWTPFDEVEFPENQVLEFPGDTSVANNGMPENVYDGSVFSHSEVSTQTNNGTCSDVNYTVARSWEGVAGAYDSGNTPSAVHVQNINVEDTTPPIYDNGVWSDNSGLEVAVTTDTVSTQGDDPAQCNYYNYTTTVTETGTDVCGNEGFHEHESIQTENELPYITSLPIPNNDTIYVPEGNDIHPDSIGWAEWADPEDGPIVRSYEDELIEETGTHRLWYRIQTANDPCEISPDSAYHYVHEPKPSGIENKVKKDNAQVYPNPTRENFNLHYAPQGNVTVGLYNTQGQLIEEIFYENLPADSNIPYSMQGKPKGLYILKIQGEDGSVETEKIVKQDFE